MTNPYEIKINILEQKIEQMNKDSLNKLYGFLDLKIAMEEQPESKLKQTILQKISDSSLESNKLELLQSYFDISNKIEKLPVKYILELVPIRDRKKMNKKNKSSLITSIDELFFDNRVTISELEKKVDKANLMQRIEKFDFMSLKVLAEKIGEKINVNDNNENIINKFNMGLNYGTYTNEDMMKHIDEIEKTITAGKSSQKNDKTVEKLEQLQRHIIVLEDKIDRQHKEYLALKDINLKQFQALESNQLFIKDMLEKLEKLDDKTRIVNTENILYIYRQHKLNHPSYRAESFDEILTSMVNDNALTNEFIRDSLTVMVMDYLMNLSKEVRWDVKIDDFYKILSGEFVKLVGSHAATAKIPDLRDSVCKRMDLDPDKFDELLLKCRDAQWVDLEVGTPIGETDAGWLDTGTHRFYYVKLKRR